MPPGILGDLFGWPVVGAVVCLLIGVALGLMSTTPPEFAVAKLCFTSATILIMAKLCVWLSLTAMSFADLTFGLLLVGGCFLLGIDAWHWVDAREERSVSERVQWHITSPSKRSRSAESLPVSAGPRIFEQATPFEVTEPCEGKSSLTQTAKTEHLHGRWYSVELKIQDVSDAPLGYTQLAGWWDNTLVLCDFRTADWNNRLIAYDIGDMISVIGMIYFVRDRGIGLKDCEIVEKAMHAYQKNAES